MTQGVQKQIGTLPAIETEFHLFEIGREMFGANPMPRSHDAALEKGESGFNGVGVNVAHDVYAGTVVNLLVIRPLGFPHGRFVRGCVVSENDFHILADILADVLCECSPFGVSGMEEPEITVTLADTDHHFFVVHAGDTAFALVPSADVSNVHLHLAVKHRLIGLGHGVPDAMAEKPRCFVAHSDRALNLAGGHAFLRFTEKMRREKPLGEWEVRIVKHGAGCNGELVVTVFAVEELLVGVEFDHGAFTAQAARSFREAEPHKQLAALIFGAKQGVYIN